MPRMPRTTMSRADAGLSVSKLPALNAATDQSLDFSNGSNRFWKSKKALQVRAQFGDRWYRVPPMYLKLRELQERNEAKWIRKPLLFRHLGENGMETTFGLNEHQQHDGNASYALVRA
jgi:hypothetical protein